MQPQVGSIAHVHPRHYANFSQLHKHMVAADRKLKRNQTTRWECCTILPVSQVEHLLMYWPHRLLQPPGLKLHSLHSNWKLESKRRKTSNARETERMRTLVVALRPKPGKWRRPCNHRRREHHSESPPQCNALDGPASHLQLQSFHYRPSLHNSSNSKSNSRRSGLADNKSLASMTGSGTRKVADSCFTNTIRLYTKNSLSIYN